MNTTLNQKISEFLDDDLSADEALDLLKAMRHDAELSNTLSRYAAVSHALKTHELIKVKPDFLSGISAQLADEPAYLLPVGKSKPPVARINNNVKIWAFAASVAAVAVLLVYGGGQLQQNNQASVLQTAKLQAQEPYPLNQRINDYLQAHNNSIYTYGETTVAPIAKVTAYHQQ